MLILYRQAYYYFFAKLFLSVQVDTTSKRNGGEIVAKVLEAHNIKYMFTLAGGHISPILAAAEKIGIQVVDTRHEVNGKI